MTEQSNAELIAEAATRAELCDADSREAMRDTGRIILRLADALEAADLLAETVGEQRDELNRMHRECHEQRDQLAAVMEKVRAWTKVATTGPSGKVQGYTLAQQDARDILETTPADVLREHDPAKILQTVARIARGENFPDSSERG